MGSHNQGTLGCIACGHCLSFDTPLAYSTADGVGELIALQRRSWGMTPAMHRRLTALGIATGLTAIVALVALPVAPGIFTIDSQTIYGMGAGTGFRITNWYSPVCAALWGIATKARLPLETALVLQASLVVGGLFALYRLVLGPWVSLAVAATTVLVPPVYGFLGWVGRDVWFAGLTLCSLAGLGWMSRTRNPPWPLLFLTGIAAWLAADSRQNGFPVLVVVGGSAIHLALRHKIRNRWVLSVATVGAVVLAGSMLVLVQNAVVSVHQYPDQPLLYQDLLAVSLMLNESQLSTSIFPSQDLALVRSTWIPGNEGPTIYSRDSPIIFRPFADGAEVERSVRRDWRRMVERHPLTYLRQRLDLHLMQLAITQPTQYAFFTESDRTGPTSLRFRQDHPNINSVRLHYLNVSGGHIPSSGWLFRIWPYAVVGILASVWLIVLGGALRLLATVMLLLQVLLQFVLFFTAPQVEFRFEGFQVLLGIVALVLLVGTLLTRPRNSSIFPVHERIQAG